MKKLMIAAVAVGMSAVANAAAITWGSADSLTPPAIAGEEYLGGSITMYLYEIGVGDYSKYTGLGQAALSAAIYADYGTTSLNNDADYFGFIQLNDSRTFNSGDSAYAAVLFVYDDGVNDIQYKGNIATYTWGAEETADAAVGNLDAFVGGDTVGGQAITWQSVPEPTSGLLLLLGVAGLALRRRRA